jgi:hypothetical protein
MTLRHPDPRDHAAHDQLLVAAYAAGDADGADLQAAIALVADCADCASLHHDLRHIAAALPAMPAPVRSRDFRLTAEQAASLRPAGWRRLLLPLAGPRFSFAAPLGSGLAALGIAGLLLTGGFGLPMGGATAGAPAPAYGEPVPTDQVMLVGPDVEPTMGAQVVPEGTTKNAGNAGAGPGDEVTPELAPEPGEQTPEPGPVDQVARDGGGSDPQVPILPQIAALTAIGGGLLASVRVLARRVA